MLKSDNKKWSTYIFEVLTALKSAQKGLTWQTTWELKIHKASEVGISFGRPINSGFQDVFVFQMTLETIKGTFSDSSNLFLWDLTDIHENTLFPIFQFELYLYYIAL